MRLLLLTCMAVGLSCLFAMPASAKIRYLPRTQTYAIAGVTGEALFDAMDRKGPKHGFLTRAIAQTSYTVDWELKVAPQAGTCRLIAANPTLNLTYTYPQVSNPLPQALARRWARFMAGVRAHEEMHARIARDMVRAAGKSLAGLKLANDGSCNRVTLEAKRRIGAVYKTYEARQVAFDTEEHRDGGKVEGLVAALLQLR